MPLIARMLAMTLFAAIAALGLTLWSSSDETSTASLIGALLTLIGGVGVAWACLAGVSV